MAYIPHREYPYPLHRDEWDRIAWGNAIIESGSAVYTDPFLGEGLVTRNYEIGFGVWLAIVKLVSDTPWWSFYRYFPVFNFVFLVLSTYILANRWGYGLEAAFFVSLMPTTVRFLGPAFLVPVSLCLVFVPLSLFLFFNYSSLSSQSLAVLMLLFVLVVHPPTLLAILIVLAIYVVLNRDWKAVLTLVLVSSIGFFVLKYHYGQAVVMGTFKFGSFIIFSNIFRELGFFSVIFSVVGCFWILTGYREDQALVYGVIVLLIINFSYRRLDYALLLMPERNLIYIMLLLSIIAGNCLSRIGDRRIIFGLVLLIFFLSYQSHVETKYYQIIDGREFEDFRWIRENLEGKKAVLDPWKAIAFVGVAEKNVYSYLFPGPNNWMWKRNAKVWGFLNIKCKDTAFLRKNKISIVYSANGCDNEDLVKVRERVYVLE